jgi:hypothetical protein
MAARRRKEEQSNAGWLYADVLLGLLVVFLAASGINKRIDTGDEFGSTSTTSTTTPDECSSIERDPKEFDIEWNPADGNSALLNKIKNGLGNRDSDDVGVLLVFGGAKGTTSEEAKSAAEEIWNVVKTGEKYRNAYKKFLFTESLPKGYAQLSFFMERLCD